MIGQVDNSLPQTLGESTLSKSDDNKKKEKTADAGSGSGRTQESETSDTVPVRMRHLGTMLDIVA